MWPTLLHLPPLCNMLEDREQKTPFLRLPHFYMWHSLCRSRHMNVIFGKQKQDREVALLLFPLASSDANTLVFLWQCSRGPRVWYLLLWVPGTSILMAWIWTEVICLDPAVRAAIALFSSFLIISQFSDHDTGNVPWLAHLAILPDEARSLFPQTFEQLCMYLSHYITSLWV